MTCGVAARPASWRATVVTGRAKNSRKAPEATSQTTTMPVRMRRIRKPTIAMSLPSRHRGAGHEVLELTAPAPPHPCEDPFGAGVHRVPDTVAEQVEGERGDEQRRGREHDVPPGHLVEIL